MSPTETGRTRKGFGDLRTQIDADPARRARVEEHKAVMLGELRRELDLTQVAVAERLDVTQASVSYLERSKTDVRLSTLSRYVQALGGRLEIQASFPGQTVPLKIGGTTPRQAKSGRRKPGTRRTASAPEPKSTRRPRATAANRVHPRQARK